MIAKLAIGYVNQWREMDLDGRVRFALRLKKFGDTSHDEFSTAARIAYRKILSELSEDSHTGAGKWTW